MSTTPNLLFSSTSSQELERLFQDSATDSGSEVDNDDTDDTDAKLSETSYQARAYVDVSVHNNTSTHPIVSERHHAERHNTDFPSSLECLGGVHRTRAGNNRPHNPGRKEEV